MLKTETLSVAYGLAWRCLPRDSMSFGVNHQRVEGREGSSRVPQIADSFSGTGTYSGRAQTVHAVKQLSEMN